jgi:hypothetical protein
MLDRSSNVGVGQRLVTLPQVLRECAFVRLILSKILGRDVRDRLAASQREKALRVLHVRIAHIAPRRTDARLRRLQLTRRRAHHLELRLQLGDVVVCAVHLRDEQRIRRTVALDRPDALVVRGAELAECARQLVEQLLHLGRSGDGDASERERVRCVVRVRGWHHAEHERHNGQHHHGRDQHRAERAERAEHAVTGCAGATDAADRQHRRRTLPERAEDASDFSKKNRVRVSHGVPTWGLRCSGL